MGCLIKAYQILNTPQWSGNISTMEWNTPALALNLDWQAYKYDYDPLSRLTAGAYSSSSSAGSGYGAYAGYYDESYTYDIMGNMQSLLRKHDNTLVDDLTFKEIFVIFSKKYCIFPLYFFRENLFVCV